MPIIDATTAIGLSRPRDTLELVDADVGGHRGVRHLALDAHPFGALRIASSAPLRCAPPSSANAPVIGTSTGKLTSAARTGCDSATPATRASIDEARRHRTFLPSSCVRSG